MATRPLPAPEILEQQLVTLIGERLLEPSGEFSAGSNLYDAGLDSMAIMQLLILIEQEYGVAIPDNDLTRHQLSSVRNLATLIRDCHGGGL
ncbi:MAG TPA: acyl carrier protein [Chthoniobacteraceae bacterium]|jgi:acyl carrier protein